MMRAIQALEKRGLRNTDSTTADKESVDESQGDTVDLQRDGDLDPASLKLIDQILATEDDN